MRSPLATFLYLLMRDETVPGVIEKLVREAEKEQSGDNSREDDSNQHLVRYAVELAERLEG